MEKKSNRIISFYLIVVMSLIVINCGNIFKYEDAKRFYENEKFDKAISKLKEIEIDKDDEKEKQKHNDLMTKYKNAQQLFKQNKNKYYFIKGKEYFDENKYDTSLNKFEKIDKNSPYYRKAKAYIEKARLTIHVHRIRELVKSKLEGMNNLNTPYLKNIEIVKQIKGGLGVFVEFNADDNIKKKYIRGGIENKMAEIYKALYSEKLNVTASAIAAYFPAGKMVYKTIVNKREANKMDWTQDEIDISIYLKKVWKVAWLDSSIR